MSIETSAIGGVYAADPIHSSVTFAVRYMGVSTFRAGFDRISAKFEGRPNGANLSGSADVDSISIQRPEQFRAHVLGDEFFAADAHPQITFSANDVMLLSDGTASVNGSMTIRGNTQPLVARGRWSRPAADPTGKTRSHLELEATLNRRDYGLKWNVLLPDGGSALADEVTITAELALVAEG
jgi:polyisoprenoid-binding protein YceI